MSTTSAEKRFLRSSDVDWTLSLSFIRNATCYLVYLQCNPVLNLSTFEAEAQPLCRFAEPVTALNSRQLPQARRTTLLLCSSTRVPGIDFLVKPTLQVGIQHWIDDPVPDDWTDSSSVSTAQENIKSQVIHVADWT